MVFDSCLRASSARCGSGSFAEIGPTPIPGKEKSGRNPGAGSFGRSGFRLHLHEQYRTYRNSLRSNDDQAFVSWMCVAWVAMTLCQLGVTVAGNLSVIPLTGVTFPFVSFGMTSLVINMAMLGLALNVRDVPRE